MAEWLVDGGSTFDLHECDLNRFETHQLAPAFIHDRGIQNYVEVYDIVHPLQPMEEPRPLRTSPFYEREQELGAYFLEGGGWERPHWFGVNEGLLDRYEIPGRQRVGGPLLASDRGCGGAGDARRRGDVRRDATQAARGRGTRRGWRSSTGSRRIASSARSGRVVYSLLLDERGGIRSDLTIARLGPDRFQIGANGNARPRPADRRAPDDGDVSVRDITSGTCCIGLWGPRARDVLAAVTDADLSNEAFGYFRAREMWVGKVPVTALRLSYVGELGWELYTSADMGLRLWDTLGAQAGSMVSSPRGAARSARSGWRRATGSGAST